MNPTPFYDHDGITIYHGDCGQIIPYLDQVDLLLTDPPYGMEFRSNHRNIKHDKIEACLFYPGERHAFTKRIPDVIICERTGNDLHPTQKPVGVMAQIISAYSTTASTILDPFMGSGTTLVAAKNQGKRAIGIEREIKYCEIAVQRLAQQSFLAAM